MKINKKVLLILPLSVAALFSCVNNGGSSEPEPIPPGPTPEPADPLKFTATQDNSTIGYNTNGTVNTSGIQYSTNDGKSWTSWTGADIPLDNGQSICVKNTNNTLSIDDWNYFSFTMDGEIAASGEVSSMINSHDLTPYCFYYLFYNCGVLTSSPELPATELAEGCYSRMFFGCASLTSAPDLKAPTLVEKCYENMFYACSNITTAPTISATTLADDCCYCMFENCTSLTSSPALPDGELKSYCYHSMFKGCTSLKIREATESSNKEGKIFTCPDIASLTNPVKDMFKDTIGDFKDGTPNSGNTYCWCDPLKFTATQDNSTIGFTTSGVLDIHIQYSQDDGKNWQNWTNGSNKVNLDKGEIIRVRNTANTLSTQVHSRFKFTMSGKIEASGDISSMINYAELSKYCYSWMFSGCTSLTQAKDLILPATALADSCYYELFHECRSLVTSPKLLPALKVSETCYCDMFSDCDVLVSTPELPAMELDKYCYENMFKNCSSLPSVPELPATTLARSCYEYMFAGCSKLKIREEEGETTGPKKIFTCPNYDESFASTRFMFNDIDADATFKGGTPTSGHTYYWYE